MIQFLEAYSKRAVSELCSRPVNCCFYLSQRQVHDLTVCRDYLQATEVLCTKVLSAFDVKRMYSPCANIRRDIMFWLPRV